MFVLIISDSHGIRYRLDEVLNRVKKVDMIIHLGDICGDAEYLRKQADCPVHIVAGNNDFGGELPREEIIEIADKQIWLTHGHRYHVNYGLAEIIEEAETLGMDIVMFGHTHVPVVREENGLNIVNPGSLAYPRQIGYKPSYILMEVDLEKNFHFSLDYLD